MQPQETITTTDTPKRSQSGMTLESLETASFWANVLVVVLTGLLAIAGGFAWYFSSKLGEMKDEALTRFKLESSKEIAAANERASQADARAAEAQLELERFKAPRSLSDVQQAELRDKLKAFRGISVDMFLYGETIEILGLAKVIGRPLAAAGWTTKVWTTVGGGAVSGIFVMTKEGSDDNVEKAAEALVSALVKAELVTIKRPPNKWDAPAAMLNGPPWDASKAAPIRMLIGSKP